MIYVTQMVFVHPGKENVFLEFENLVLPLMEKYTGKMMYRIRAPKESFVVFTQEIPYEIHVISFESHQDFKAYMSDPTRLQWLHMKEEAVKSNLVVVGEKI